MMIVLPALISCIVALFGSVTADPVYNFCYGGNYTAKSPFQSNLNLLLASLSSSNAAFFTDGEGSAPDRAYGLVLCRGDVGPADCAACIKTAARDVTSLCPVSRKATVWYDYCELRYDDISFFSTVDESSDIDYLLANQKNATDIESFIELVKKLLDAVTSAAAYNSSDKFATGIASNGSGSPTIYALAQCTRDLSPKSCSGCMRQIRVYFDGFWMRIGGRILGQSCSFRYETYTFFGGTPTIWLGLSAPPPVPDAPPPSPPAAPPPPAPNNDKENKSATSHTVLEIVTPLAAALVLIFAIYICRRRRRSRKRLSSIDKLDNITNVESLFLDLYVIKAATGNFSPVNKLGEGGFGSVYKGVLPDGQEIAVKRLSTSSKQGIGELKNELVLVAKLQHKNLVKLLGVCLHRQEKLLVYEYVTNRSLDTFLFDPIRQKELNWEMRFKIVRGISQGLHYLHEESRIVVIHRDLKASNILLDANMNPKISDFGLSRLFGGEEEECSTRQVVGTLGYMAPEYVKRGQFSIKSDVYSFGVLLLEIVTGKKMSKFHDTEHYRDLLGYAWDHWTKGMALEILDLSMKEKYSENEVLICVQIGLLCTQEVPADRPLMSSVLMMLNGSLTAIPTPSQTSPNTGKSAPYSENSENKYSSVSSDGFGRQLLPYSGNDDSISEVEPR